ncbi:sensor histidine kinase [Ectobacillus panaciterrae]|uniref:sensor histidine kinase n=1 Tax=Ectobacillus panaciterrae TaxID=363872 RepID=UPI0003FFCB84|nr:sensor histidine kinase [Ectobacillus panaciterrae]
MQIKKFQLFPDKHGYFPLIWLVYLFFPLHYLMEEPRLKMIVGYLLLAIFIVAYRQVYFAKKRMFSLWVMIQIGIIFTYSAFYHINYVYMHFFVATFVGMAFTRKQFIQLFSMFVSSIAFSLILQRGTWSLDDILNMLPMLILMLLFPFGLQAGRKRKELEGKLNKANEQIQELVKREERQRIARDLHDTLGHTLSLITLKSQLVEKLVTKDPERAKLEAKEIEQTSRAALKQVRELVTEMRSITIAEEIVQVQAILQAAGIAFQYEEEADTANIAPLTQNIMGMCLREAVTNVVKHSQATVCTVRVYITKGETVLEVKDNGVGIQSAEGNGLNGIQERLALLEGVLKLASGNGGTEVAISIPLVRKEKDGMTG